jgi:hypothetical protein
VDAEDRRQRGRNSDAQLMSFGVHSNGLVAAPLSGLSVGGQKHPSSVPAVPPLPLGHLGGKKVVAAAPYLMTANCDRWAPCRQIPFYSVETVTQRREAATLLEPLPIGAVAARHSGTTAAIR